ncbi:MAG: hypothetical protein HKN26_15615, partial [Acidimicrobiales bacterium]|nr:hypothetical protein [Acidimicrobiales bacterium]
MSVPLRRWGSALLALALVAAACSSDGESSPATEAPTTTASGEVSTETTTPPATSEAPPIDVDDRAFYILPPGNYGGLPTNDDSLDQLALYDGLTPLRGNVTDTDIEELYLAQDFEPIGETTVEDTGRPGTTITYDEFGVAHI